MIFTTWNVECCTEIFTLLGLLDLEDGTDRFFLNDGN